jgi:hypothetical protein
MIILPSISAGNSNSSSLNPDSLVFHVETRNPYCYSGTGSSISDLRKINTNGTLSEIDYVSSDKSLITLDTDSYVSFNRGFSPVTNQFTFIICVHLPTIAAFTYPNIFSSDNAFFGGIFIYYGVDGANDIRFYISEDVGTNYYEIIDTNIGSLDNKFIIAASVNGTTMKLYRNGVLRAFDNSHTAGNVNIQSKINIGYAVDAIFTTAQSLKVYEAMIYNRALSDNEILQNYNTLKSKYGL